MSREGGPSPSLRPAMYPKTHHAAASTSNAGKSEARRRSRTLRIGGWRYPQGGFGAVAVLWPASEVNPESGACRYAVERPPLGRSWPAHPGGDRPGLAESPSSAICAESRRRTNQLFVTMPFDPELNAFFKKVVKPAARAAGHDPVRIDRRPPEGYITKAILSTIRRAVLVLVDLTLERPNCYFEAGYARGAFRRVIFTCRADHDPRRTDRGSYRVHFDADTFPPSSSGHPTTSRLPVPSLKAGFKLSSGTFAPKPTDSRNRGSEPRTLVPLGARQAHRSTATDTSWPSEW